jgi:hypothetical protein
VLAYLNLKEGDAVFNEINSRKGTIEYMEPCVNSSSGFKVKVTGYPGMIDSDWVIKIKKPSNQLTIFDMEGGIEENPMLLEILSIISMRIKFPDKNIDQDVVPTVCIRYAKEFLRKYNSSIVNGDYLNDLRRFIEGKNAELENNYI